MAIWIIESRMNGSKEWIPYHPGFFISERSAKADLQYLLAVRGKNRNSEIRVAKYERVSVRKTDRRES